MWKMILIEMVGILLTLYIATVTVPWFIMIAILVILFVVFVVVGGQYGLKGVGVSILVYVVSFMMFHYYYKYACGPNRIDVKVMQPMAEKISDYIVKYGIPKSLKDIPDLPYNLEGCKKNITFKKYTGSEDIDVYNQDEATYKIEEENCIYSNYGRIYKVGTYLNQDFTDTKFKYLNLKIYRDESKTGVAYDLEYDQKNRKWKMEHSLDEKYQNIRIYDNKTSGICHQLKQ